MIRCMVDTESAPLDDVDRFLGAIQAPANYTKEESIKKYIEEATAKERDKAALDPDLARIVCLCFQFENEPNVRGAVAKTAEEERVLLQRFWHLFRTHNGLGGVALVGFNIWGHDFPLMVRRSQYLGVDYPKLRTGRYAYQRPQILDIQDALTMDRHEKFRLRSRVWWLKRLGLELPDDPNGGSDVPLLIATGKWDAVLHHCKSDVTSQIKLAEWAGMWESDKYLSAA